MHAIGFEAVIWVSLRSIYWAPTVYMMPNLRAEMVAAWPEDSHPGRESKPSVIMIAHVALGSMGA